MSIGRFPLNANERRVILVLNEHDIEKCVLEPKAGRILIDDEAHILQYPLSDEEDIPALRNIIDANLVRPGAMLIQSPYDADVYEDAENATMQFSLAKQMYFSTICMHLGAKEVIVEQVDRRTNSGKVSLKVEGERLGIGGQATVEDTELEIFRSLMSTKDEFKGGNPDIAAAECLLRRTRLIYNPNMRSLVEMRRCNSNQIVARKITLNLSSEAKTNLKIAGRIGVPEFINLSADYRKKIEETCEYTLTVEVRF